MKMIIFNCPAYKGLIGDIPDWLDNTNCGYYTGQVPCQDCDDCVMKQIVKKCKKSLEVSYCPIEQEILELLDIREVE